MMRKSLVLFVLISFAFLTACSQNENLSDQIEVQSDLEETSEERYSKPHPHGGWFCPDNLVGFPPVDIQHLDKVAVVSGRLPTKEETQNGSALMYIDTEKIPDARQLDMKLPRLARMLSGHNNMKEQVIVIQAVIAGNDTVVGYRYPHGGNGSA